MTGSLFGMSVPRSHSHFLLASWVSVFVFYEAGGGFSHADLLCTDLKALEEVIMNIATYLVEYYYLVFSLGQWSI